ncbi:hypothetical protein M501DRAFT_988961 [Patellaria atrata CBS 101060]|uniref:Thioesterase domain-containing protein n=1 Tax=Patellaria atrata CBS 101060 TaxID=1346257 RepID=A0A9P4VLD6_9PEZI|nr:hypothetical protein M501DRAFT_988961 [Patellaria atrata CBS 101060]
MKDDAEKTQQEVHELVNWFLERAVDPDYNGHDKCLVGALSLDSVTISPSDRNNVSSRWKLHVTPALCNLSGNLHGGAVALIFDMCTSMTIIPVTREGFWDTGHVTRSLNCTYLRAAPEGTRLVVECELVSIGKRTALLRGIMKREDDGKICFTCDHDRVAIIPTPDVKL